MSIGHLSVCKAFSCYIVGARATGVCTGICTWAVTHRGFGKWEWFGESEEVGGV